MKHLLVDGSNLSVIHLAANPALGMNGEPVGLLKGFFNAIVNINRLILPDAITIFFDGPGGSARRRQIYKEYKSGRKPRTLVGQAYQFLNEDQAIANQDWQKDHLLTLLDCCGINVIITDGYETDDGIAYLISTNPDDEFFIVSCDKDFCQLLSDRVKIYNPISKEVQCVSWLLKKYEIHPNNWLFYRAITGDKSDNIPGVKGFGPKTLKKLFLLNRENKLSLDIIPECAQLMRSEEKLDAAGKRVLKRLEQLEENMELLRRNWQIMDLSDPLMAVHHMEQIAYQVNEFKPIIKTKDFYIALSELGGLGLNANAPKEFVKLSKRKNI